MCRLALLLTTAALIVGCTTADPTPPPVTATPLTTRIEGRTTRGGLRVALCELQGSPTMPLACTLTGLTGTTTAEGAFRFMDVPPATYALLYDAGAGGFADAVEAWRGRTLIIGDWGWLRDEYLPGGSIPALTGSPPPNTDPIRYGLQTLQLSGSAFVLAHGIGSEGSVVPALAEVDYGTTADLRFDVVQPQPFDLATVRAEVGPLTDAEVERTLPAVRERWAAFLAGDDSAFRDTDLRLIERIRAGDLYRIGGTLLTTIEEQEGELVKRIGYAIFDPQQGQRIVAWYDPVLSEVIEAETGYVLNVRDDPGEGIREGPNGEQFYIYGFSYYQRWGRILPDPVIDMVNRFYGVAPGHVGQFASDYSAARATFGGDLDLLVWDQTIPQDILTYAPPPSAPPTLYLPDSGTVDVRRERFLQAVIEGRVTVDEESIVTFLASEEAANNRYLTDPDPQAVVDLLLTPYRSGHLFDDMEAALILSATYEGDPLVIGINDRIQTGFLVPRRRDSTVYVGPQEVSDVILGYGGTLNARWPHEMSHIVEFRAPQYEWRSREGGFSTCEPLKYMMEFMWWVERYPYDAPDTDWMPIGSGLTLSRLLTNTFPNSGC